VENKEQQQQLKTVQKGVFRKLLRYLIKRWPVLLASTVCVILYANAMSIMPVIISKTIDLGISQRDLYNTVKYALTYLLVVAFSGAVWFLVRYLSELLSQSVSHDIRVEAFQAIYAQSMDFFDNVMRGQLVSRIINDTDRIGRTVSWQVRNIFNITFTAALSLYYMFTMSPRLFYVALISLTIMAVVNVRYAIIIRPIYDNIRHQLGVLTSVVTDNLNGFKTVRALSIEDYEIEKFSNENNKFLNLNLNAAKIRAIYGNLSQLVLGGSLAAIVYFGGTAVVAGTLSIGELTAFISYMMLLMWPMRALGFIISSLQRGLAAASRVFAIIDQPPRIQDKPGAIELESIKGEIKFENVHFSYIEGKPILKGISFRVAPGEKVLITGPPGSGKSTIIKLLLRFYEPDSGRILVDGYDISDIKMRSLRAHIGVVHQEPFIFSGTIKENIMFGNPKASMEEVIRAAMIAKIHDFISTLPNGYDTVVGERGITLSGGQRQRIDIARAILKDPKIILLDDPVSNLDAKTEKELVEDLRNALRGRTAIIVSQRMSLVSLADRIIVMEDGRIVEEGTHEELMAKKGLYYKLYMVSVGKAEGRRDVR